MATQKKKSPVRRLARGSLSPSPIQLRTILVPVDFSASAEKAVHYAVSFARQFGAKITLMHVVEPPVFPTELGYVPVEIESLTKAITASAEEKIEQWAKTVAKNGTAVDVMVLTGHPYQKITEVAKTLRADMIVVSTHGYTGLKHVFLGSTAERIVRHAGCPVLVVRERERDFV